MAMDYINERRDALLAELQKGLADRGLGNAVLSGPVELLETRAQSIDQRIEALELAKKQHAARIDAQIEALRGEAAELGGRIKVERKQRAPAVKKKAAAGVKGRKAKPVKAARPRKRR